MKKIEKKAPIFKATPANIRAAGKLIAAGKLVAFPTETVYGLGANAMDARAVAGIFLAKGRPSDNPLIVHIATMKELEMVARDVPSVALMLMKEFWPGPLTFVLRKQRAVPDVVTAGGPTVAVRMPNHRVALALIRAAGCPVAAPSANLAGKPSPTTAAHVAEDFGPEVAMILDGGRTRHGLESTVIDVTRAKVEILRSGAVTAEMMEKVLGYKPKIVAHVGSGGKGGRTKDKLRSPGMKYRHYAPSVPMILIGETDEKNMVRMLQTELRKLSKKSRASGGDAGAGGRGSASAQACVGVLCVKEHASLYSRAKFPAVKKIVVCGAVKNPALFGKHLYASLRKFHRSEVDLILAENPGAKGIGHAVYDRLSRAATKIL